MGTLPRRTRSRVLTLSALAPALAAVGAPAGAAAGTETTAPSTAHCVARAQALGTVTNGAQPEVKCFATFAEALRSIGISVDLGTEPSQYAAIARSRTVGSGESFPYDVLAIHYRQGGTLSVFGTDCNGNGIPNLGTYGWNDAITATQNIRCGNVKHFRDINYGDYAGSTTGYYTPPYAAPGSPYISSVAYFP
ncbi:MAG: hypothetical protein N2037_10640 [Acidimicrobiales bacterium]|nr:hypothetical protein [Acidimicrobiales bacterium]